jgi:hypothetical protein
VKLLHATTDHVSPGVEQPWDAPVAEVPGGGVGVPERPSLDLDPRSQPSAVGDDSHISRSSSVRLILTSEEGLPLAPSGIVPDQSAVQPAADVRAIAFVTCHLSRLVRGPAQT